MVYWEADVISATLTPLSFISIFFSLDINQISLGTDEKLGSTIVTNTRCRKS
jgi:hypothetical protein